MKNYYRADEKHVDLDKLRAEADRAAQGDDRNEPQDVVIHLHAHGVPCLGQQHEEYPRAVQVDS